MDLDRSREFGVRSGRIILLGDGTEVIPDQNEDEPFDRIEEEHDEPSTTNEEQEQTGSTDTTRNDREGTPGPQTKSENGTPSSANISESPASTATTDRNNSGEGAGQKSGSS